MKALVLALLASAAILAAAPPAPAKAPSTSEQGSLDWILLRFAKDREEESKGTGVVDEVAAYGRGESPVEDWKKMMAIILGSDKPVRKELAAQAIVDRFGLEGERRAIEAKALWEIKKSVCRETLKPMTIADTTILRCIFKVQRALLPSDWVTWSPSDTLTKRRDAGRRLEAKLK